MPCAASASPSYNGISRMDAISIATSAGAASTSVRSSIRLNDPLLRLPQSATTIGIELLGVRRHRGGNPEPALRADTCQATPGRSTNLSVPCESPANRIDAVAPVRLGSAGSPINFTAPPGLIDSFGPLARPPFRAGRLRGMRDRLHLAARAAARHPPDRLPCRRHRCVRVEPVGVPARDPRTGPFSLLHRQDLLADRPRESQPAQLHGVPGSDRPAAHGVARGRRHVQPGLPADDAC